MYSSWADWSAGQVTSRKLTRPIFSALVPFLAGWVHTSVFTLQCENRSPRTLLQHWYWCSGSRRALRFCSSTQLPGNAAAGLWTLGVARVPHSEEGFSSAESALLIWRNEGEWRHLLCTSCHAGPPKLHLLQSPQHPEATGITISTKWSTAAQPFNEVATWPEAAFCWEKEDRVKPFGKNRSAIAPALTCTAQWALPFVFSHLLLWFCVTIGTTLSDYDGGMWLALITNCGLGMLPLPLWRHVEKKEAARGTS